MGRPVNESDKMENLTEIEVSEIGTPALSLAIA
jgi:hypothetical protein